jgi:small subunit ribosomal protein S6
MVILPAEADESVVSTAVERIAKVSAVNGGEVANIDRWGRRRFAYELQHLNEGYYVVVNFTAEPSAQSELERVLNLADEVIRFKVILLPVKKPEKVSDKDANKETKESASSPAPA